MKRSYRRSVSYALLAMFTLMTIGANVQASLDSETAEALRTLTKESAEPSAGAADDIVHQPGDCTGAVIQGYSCQVIAERWRDANQQSFNLGDDGATHQNLGMSFEFAGNTFTTASVCANGYLVLGQAMSFCEFFGLDPESFPYAYAVVAHGMDLHPGATGNSVYVARTDVDGMRAFVATWAGVKDLSSNMYTFAQIVLFDNGGIWITKDISSDGLFNIGIGIATGIGGLAYQYSKQESGHRTVVFSPETGLPDPPTACFDHSAQSITYTFQIVQFTDCSFADRGTISSRIWTFGDGTQSSETHPTKSYSESADYTVCLLVTDTNGLSHSTCKGIRIHNRAPVASFDLESTSVLTNVSPLTLVDTSTDPDGEVVSRDWLIDGTRLDSTESRIDLDPLSAGWHALCVNPQDDDGQSDVSCRSVLVNAVVMAGHGVAVRNTNGTAQFNETDTYEQLSELGFAVTNQSLVYEDANVTLENARSTTTATIGQVDTRAHIGYLRAILPNGQTLEAQGVQARASTNCYEDSGSTSFQTLLLDGVPIDVNLLDIAPNTRIVLTPDSSLVLNLQRPGMVGMTTIAVALEHADGTMTGLGYAHAGIDGCPWEFRP